MALTRVSDKKIAANRRNAQKSTGPRTSEGKARSSRNGCLHYAYARRHFMPESWDRELCEEAKTITRATTDPIRRGYELDLVYHILWAIRLCDQETQLRSHCLKRFPGEPKRAAHLLVFDPCAQAFIRHLRRAERKVAASMRDLQHHLRPPISRTSRTRSAQASAPAQRLNLMDLLVFLDQICRPKPDRQQNKRDSAQVTPSAPDRQLFEPAQVIGNGPRAGSGTTPAQMYRRPLPCRTRSQAYPHIAQSRSSQASFSPAAKRKQKACGAPPLRVLSGRYGRQELAQPPPPRRSLPG